MINGNLIGVGETRLDKTLDFCKWRLNKSLEAYLKT